MIVHHDISVFARDLRHVIGALSGDVQILLLFPIWEYLKVHVKFAAHVKLYCDSSVLGSVPHVKVIHMHVSSSIKRWKKRKRYRFKNSVL